MVRAFVSAGSNIEPEKNIREALHLLASFGVRVLAVSTVYLTKPIGRPSEHSYFNCIVEIETLLPPLELKHTVLRPIENQLGRKRGIDKFASRTIDLDLIVYGTVVMSNPELTLPDPDILSRPFLIAGLYELHPEMILPGARLSLAQAVKDIRSDEIKPLKAYTDSLREELRYGI